MTESKNINKIVRYKLNELKNYEKDVVYYSSGVMTFLIKYIIDQCILQTKETNSNRITPRHVQKAIKSDVELNQLLLDSIKLPAWCINLPPS
jgi:hypothetical protein